MNENYNKKLSKVIYTVWKKIIITFAYNVGISLYVQPQYFYFPELTKIINLPYAYSPHKFESTLYKRNF